MVATNLKAETVKLMDQRLSIETEMNAVIQRLCQPGAPGLSDNLLDSEGFPRTDIDIPTVRADRRRLAELKKDHMDVTEKINQNILLLHAVKQGPKSSSTSTSENCMEIDGQGSSMSKGAAARTSLEPVCFGSNSTAAESDVVAYIPFAVIDEIADSSPAAEDGLQLGDQIVKFGSVESGENMLQMVAQEVQRNQGSAISVAIMRHGALSNLSVTPRTWRGRGLLGCHFALL
ncbi:hypothetical protein RND81_07G115100 [Saponaria officinalis]|uniref:PDZ domain-containing protein n=1 Tax=Saponaria officinalis TaxID=3572 RepID=A0AAW1JQV2_SAPOF